MNIWAQNGGVYLGYLTDRLQGEPRTAGAFSYAADRHIITFGPNGSGKTRRLLVPNLAGLKNWSMLVIDPKGEMCRMSAVHRANAGSTVIVLNPFNLFGLGSRGFNPIMALDDTSDDFPDDALNLAEAIITIKSDEREPHWPQSAQDLMTALIMYARLIAVSPQDDGTINYCGNFAFVRELLGKTSSQFRDVVQDMIRVGEQRGCEELVVKASRFADIEPDNKELNSILSTALTQTRWLDSRPIKKDLNGDAIDFSIMKEKPTTIYLILPARRLVTQAPWLRLVIASVIQKLMQDVSKPKVPTLLMLDEFAQLGHLSAIENNVALMRGYGVKLWAVFQDLSQAQALYRRWESFMGNAGVLNGFAPQDVVTAEYLSKRTGITTIPVMTMNETASSSNVDPPDPTIAHSHTQRPLMYPQDLREIGDGYMVAFTHKIRGVVRSYAPYYTELPGMQQIAALDPSL